MDGVDGMYTVDTVDTVDGMYTVGWALAPEQRHLCFRDRSGLFGADF